MTGPKKNARPHGQFYVGCSGWAYSTWKPDFYPSDLPAKKLLNYYATRLNSVEVNYTFRSLPSANTVRTWLDATGASFRFSFKAPQRITHILRLRNCHDALRQFADSIAPVAAANRIGLVLFQLPPNAKADVDRLDAFLDDARAVNLKFAFEFRHESWFCADVYAALRAHSAALCIAESDDLITPEEHTAPFSCYRFRKSEYSAKDLAAVRSKLQTRAAAGDAFAYFKHEETPIGALRAVSVLEGLRSA
ncbi:MAG TPA: DUF72 domain-containing protein [Acidobacteriaceae bacterium]|nr:DUF72 domain-containing protein [Acidobacteriaceae bacterium]